MSEKEWLRKAIQAILAQNKSDVEKANEIIELFDELKWKLNFKQRRYTMTEKEKEFIEDTIDILIDYDGCKTEEQLKGLIDEVKERLSTVLNGDIDKN